VTAAADFWPLGLKGGGGLEPQPASAITATAASAAAT
jgi:hypothetical protein